MPKAYEDIKRHLLSKGFSEKEAEGSAARILNSKIRKPGEVAMGPNYEQRAAAAKRKGRK